ncbi:MAG: HlyD family secretion protein [Hyphomicrobiales bacterium]|nr:HlyD family secretion protein [Hyphomicrobiales bacterium]
MARSRNRQKGERLLKEEAPATQWDPGPPRVAQGPPAERPPESGEVNDRRREKPAADERPSSPSKPETERATERPAQKEKAPAKLRLGFIRRHPAVAVLGPLVFLIVVACGYLYWENSSHFETTDDAFIAARQFAVAPKVSGFVVAVPATDNERVKAGDVIARIDDRDYRIALAQAQAQVAAAEAGVKNSDAQIAAQEAQVAANEAQVGQAQASLVFAKEQAARFQALVRTGAGTVANAQQYASQQNQQQAALEAAQATLKLAQRQVDTLKAQRATAAANLQQAEAHREQAELNLSYTVVKADQPGRIANLTAGVGEYAPAGTALMMFVPDDIWITANYKETELDHMRPDQPATIGIDAYPGRDFHGHVASIQPGSGAAFSLLPAENATGNYVKVVQRVPVKIIFDHIPQDVTLGPGMSAVPTVRVDPAPSLWELLEAWFSERVRGRA